MKATGKSLNWRNINIPGINKGIHYRFEIRNTSELNIELGCWTKMYPDIDKLFTEFGKLIIKNHRFNYLPLTNREIKGGWKGKVRTIMQLSEIGDIVNILKNS